MPANTASESVDAINGDFESLQIQNGVWMIIKIVILLMAIIIQIKCGLKDGCIDALYVCKFLMAHILRTAFISIIFIPANFIISSIAFLWSLLISFYNVRTRDLPDFRLEAKCITFSVGKKLIIV